MTLFFNDLINIFFSFNKIPIYNSHQWHAREPKDERLKEEKNLKKKTCFVFYGIGKWEQPFFPTHFIDKKKWRWNDSHQFVKIKVLQNSDAVLFIYMERLLRKKRKV